MIIIDENLCKGCHLCIVMCYQNVYAVSNETNKKGVQLPYDRYGDKCTGCGVCEIACPDQALTVNVNKNWWVGNQSNAFNPKFSKGRK